MNPLELREITVFFSTTDDVISKGIRWFDYCSMSHCGSILPSEPNMVVDTQLGHGVRKRPLKDVHLESTGVIFFTIKAPAALVEEYENFLLKQVGKKYDLLSVIGIAIFREVEKTNRWHCSRMLAESLKVLGFEMASPGSYKRLSIRPIMDFCSGIEQGQIFC